MMTFLRVLWMERYTKTSEMPIFGFQGHFDTILLGDFFHVC